MENINTQENNIPAVEEGLKDNVTENFQNENVENSQDKSVEFAQAENNNTTETENSLENANTEFEASAESATEGAETQSEAASEQPPQDYSLLEQKYNELEANYNELQNKYQALVDFKNQIDNEKKDALINSFYMLSDEDKADVINNKLNYSLDEIEAKLSVICVRKRVSFVDNEAEKEQPTLTFNLNETGEESIAPWLKEVKRIQDELNK